MPNVNAILANAAIQVFDTNASVLRVSSPLGQITLPATNSTYYSDYPVTDTITQLNLVNTTIWATLIRSWSSNSVSVNLSVQPSGQSATTFILTPGGIWLYWQPTEPSGSGLTQISISTSTSTANCEILLAW